jgi:hypothetical protein
MRVAASSVTLAVSHLFAATRGLGRLLRIGVLAAGEDVGRGAHHGVGVIDGTDLGQAFAVAFLALGHPAW